MPPSQRFSVAKAPEYLCARLKESATVRTLCSQGHRRVSTRPPRHVRQERTRRNPVVHSHCNSTALLKYVATARCREARHCGVSTIQDLHSDAGLTVSHVISEFTEKEREIRVQTPRHQTSNRLRLMGGVLVEPPAGRCPSAGSRDPERPFDRAGCSDQRT